MNMIDEEFDGWQTKLTSDEKAEICSMWWSVNLSLFILVFIIIYLIKIMCDFISLCKNRSKKGQKCSVLLI